MAVICTGLGDSQAKSSCESKLVAANARPGAFSKRYGVWGLTDTGCRLFERIWEVVKHESRPAFHMEKPFLTAWVDL